MLALSIQESLMISKIENNCKTNKIYYWNGILDPNNLGAYYDAILNKLIDGDYAGLSLEKLEGHNVFSVRVNKKDRLLFTTINIHGDPYLMLLDEVLNHDYAKSRFLKPAVLKHYLELHGKPLCEEILHEHFKKHEDLSCLLPIKATSKQPVDYTRIDFYNNKFIELDVTQLDTITHQSLPLIISGAPGSGKSCIAMLLLAQYLESDMDRQFTILYVTKSQKLADSMRATWQALPISQNLNDNDVQFKSYQQLLEDFEMQLEDRVFVEKEHFLEWLGNHIKEYTKISATIKNTDVDVTVFEDLEAVYQEFRIISGCNNFEAYKTIGRKRALFHLENEQKWLFTAFTAYQDYLQKVNRVHTPFYYLDLKDKYKRIVVDEAQDFSHRQLLILFNLAEKGQVCYCEDNRQSLSDNKSKIPFLKQVLQSSGLAGNHITLSSSYRCPTAVIHIANAVSAIKSIVTGQGQLDIMEVHEKTKPGQVTWYSSLNESELLSMMKAAESPDFAIITTAEHKEEAKERFNTPLVFTVEEIKGLEYKSILAYRLFVDPVFKKIDKLIGNNSSSGNKNNNHRAKKDHGNEEYGPPLGSIYTAFTRTIDKLYILQEKDHGLHNIVSRLTSTISKNQPSIHCEPAVSNTIEDKTDEWFNQAKLQLALGNEGMARSICLEKLNKTDSEFDQIRKLYSVQTARVVETKDKLPCEIIKPELPTTKSVMLSTDTPKASRIKNQPVRVQQIPVNTPPKTVLVSNTVKIPEPVTKLLKNVNETTLFNFLKHKKAKEFLFHTPLSNGVCLFTELFLFHSSFKTLFYCIPKYLDLIAINMTTEALCTRITPGMVNNSMVKFNSQTESLYFNNSSPLYWFMATIEGINLFTMMVKKNPKIAKLISSEALCMPLSKDAGGDANVSPLYLLTSFEEGKKLFLYLIESNPDFCKLITLEAFCLPLTSAAKGRRNCTPFFCLSEGIIGPSLIVKIFKGNTALAMSFSGDTLCLALPNSSNNFANVSSLYLLASCMAGLNILQGMFISNPNLIHEITPEALCLLLPVKAGINAFASPLYWFSMSPKGRIMLLHIFERNETLANSIHRHSLTLKCKNTPDNVYESAALSGLLKDEAGHEILHLLFSKNTGLAGAVKPDIAKAYASFDVKLLSLNSTEAGQKILGMIDAPEKILARESNIQESRPSMAGMFSSQASLHPEHREGSPECTTQVSGDVSPRSA